MSSVLSAPLPSPRTTAESGREGEILKVTIGRKAQSELCGKVRSTTSLNVLNHIFININVLLQETTKIKRIEKSFSMMTTLTYLLN